jgi:quercetin dioxygenase-like cupin family protein
VGGTLVGAKQTAPGQMRGTGLDGGQTYHMSKGDVITIPAKTPHWWKEVPTKTVAYYAINIESK